MLRSMIQIQYGYSGKYSSESFDAKLEDLAWSVHAPKFLTSFMSKHHPHILSDC